MKKVLILQISFLIMSLSAIAQQTVTARVFDIKTNKPVIDAEVRIKDSDVTTKTNARGFFQLTADTSTVLVISNIEYETNVIKVPVATTFQVGLEPAPLYTVTPVMAEFPGGQTEMFKYIYKNLKYPDYAKKERIIGKVFVQFTIERDGSIPEKSIVIQKSLFPSCDAEAKRLIQSFPIWLPAKVNNGKIVRSIFVLPIQFNTK